MIFGLRKRVATLENKIAVIEFEKEHPSGYALDVPRTSGSMYRVCRHYDLLFIKNGKIQRFELPAVHYSLSVLDTTAEDWELDGERLLKVRTFKQCMGAFEKVVKTTEVYTFDKRELMLIKHDNETKTEDKSKDKKGDKK